VDVADAAVDAVPEVVAAVDSVSDVAVRAVAGLATDVVSSVHSPEPTRAPVDTREAARPETRMPEERFIALITPTRARTMLGPC
jgi:hypothetical protein